MYDDGLCSLCYTTNLLKDGCLACISSSYDKNAKMGTSVLLSEICDICLMCSYKELSICGGGEIICLTYRVQVQQQFLMPFNTDVFTCRRDCLYDQS